MNVSRLKLNLAGTLFLAALCGGCPAVPDAGGRGDTFALDLTLPPESRTGGAIVFCVDGVNAQVFLEMLAAGELPSFKKHFVDRGMYCPRTVAALPSNTLPCFTSVVTGVLPGRHGIVANNWFDRNQLFCRYYEFLEDKNLLDQDYLAGTIYEQFPQELTVADFLQPHRGATKWFENSLSAGPAFAMGDYEYVDRLALYRFKEAWQFAREYRQFPAVMTVYQLSPDFRAYRHGVNSKEYRQALKHADDQIGRVLGDLTRAGLLEKTVIAMVSDHGHSEVSRHFEVEKFLRQQAGMKLPEGRVSVTGEFEDRLAYFRNVTAMSFTGGNKFFAMYLRRPIRDEKAGVQWAPWTTRPAGEDICAFPTGRGSVDLPALLVRQEAVDMVAYCVAPGQVRVVRKEGAADFIRLDDGRIRYSPVQGEDPLGWAGKVSPGLLKGDAANGGRWLSATIDTDYPDLPQQIVTYFLSPRAGDLVAFAANDWDFRVENRSGHGGPRRDEMLVPMMLAGPGIPHKTIDHARSVDLMPTLLQALEKPVPENLDGKSLLTKDTPTTSAAATVPAAPQR